MEEKFIDSILKSTISNSIIWDVKKSTFSSETNHYYSTTLNDGTVLELQIYLNIKDLSFRECDQLIIRNPNLVNG